MTYAEFVKQAALLDVGVINNTDAPLKVELDKEAPVEVNLRQPIDINLVPSQMSPESAAAGGALAGGTLGYLFGPEHKGLRLLTTLASAGIGGVGGYYGSQMLRKKASIQFLNKLAAGTPKIKIDKVVNGDADKQREAKTNPVLRSSLSSFLRRQQNPEFRYSYIDLGKTSIEDMTKAFDGVKPVPVPAKRGPSPSVLSNYFSSNGQDYIPAAKLQPATSTVLPEKK